METKTYTKMCDCPEIQEQRSKEGIEVACWVTRYLYISKSFDYWTMVKAPHVWLPQQDDIQKMFKEEAFVLAGEFSHTMESFITGDPSWWTMEGLWLAFYMWKKHGKIWDGKEWVEEVLDK
ncbi:unnamed protein product [marine sediment metagenome]|uniref:Uncharacterized protein n=1 Tax=marine sediment metagenome TaxID=412755 RepID=X1UIZ3_9ZZZZ